MGPAPSPASCVEEVAPDSTRLTGDVQMFHSHGRLFGLPDRLRRRYPPLSGTMKKPGGVCGKINADAPSPPTSSLLSCALYFAAPAPTQGGTPPSQCSC